MGYDCTATAEVNETPDGCDYVQIFISIYSLPTVNTKRSKVKGQGRVVLLYSFLLNISILISECGIVK